MTLDEIDKALAEWQSRLSLASANLLELDDLFTFKRLMGAQGLTPCVLTGVTQAQVTPALTSIRELWQNLQRLTDVVKQASDLRPAAQKLFGGDKAIREIQRLLTTDSIKMTTKETPLAIRGLLSSSEQGVWLSPQELLAGMQQTFETAKTTILAVDAAWKRLEPSLESADKEAVELQALADSLGEGALNELSVARRKLAALHAQIDNDPLGASADFTGEIGPALQGVRTRLNDLKNHHLQVLTDLKRGRQMLSALSEVRAQCEEAWKTCALRVESPTGLRPPMNPATIADLDSWLMTLENAARQSQWRPAEVGLQRWMAAAEGALSSEQAALTANNAPLEARAELKGRLSSLKVKAQAYAARGIPMDAGLNALAAEAEAALERRPARLNEATDLVARYETQLTRSLSRK